VAELITTRHARFAAERRNISRAVFRSVVYSPDVVEPGNRPGTERRIAMINGENVGAVVAIERRHLRLITVYRLSGTAALVEDNRPRT